MSTVSGIDSGLGPTVNVKDGAGTPSAQGEKHRDPSSPPRLTAVAASLTVTFDNDGPNVNYRPIDAAVKIKVDVPNGVNHPANVIMARVEFGTAYRNANGQDVPPIVSACDETIPASGPPIWRATNVTS